MSHKKPILKDFGDPIENENLTENEKDSGDTSEEKKKPPRRTKTDEPETVMKKILKECMPTTKSDLFNSGMCSLLNF
jgi:hypothetical protein